MVGTLLCVGLPGTARADVCSTKQVKTTTSTVCITMIQPQGGTPVSPSPGQTVNVNGNTMVTAVVSYTPASVPSGEQRGCGGQRRTPSGCMSFYVNGSYTLTRLYFNSSSTDTATNTKRSVYSWVWATSQYPNGTRTLSANVQNNGTTVQADVPVSIANSSPGMFPSPIPNNGRLPTSLPTSGQAGGFVAAAFGDGPSGSVQTTAVSNLVHSWSPGMILYLGDVYQRGMKDEFMNFYDPLYGADWAKTLPTIGNHEYKELTDGGGYFWYWNYPKTSPVVAGGGGGWYSMNVAGWHIISLNSNVDMSSTGAQGTWLKNDIAADEAARPLSGRPCTLAFWHAARYSDISLRKPSTSSFWNQLYPYHADVIVNAHSHTYERWTNMSNSGAKATVSPTGIPAGITEFVNGSGGNVLAQTWQTNSSFSDFRQNTRWGSLKLTLFPDHADFEYWAAKTGSTSVEMLDSGTIKCH